MSRNISEIETIAICASASGVLNREWIFSTHNSFLTFSTFTRNFQSAKLFVLNYCFFEVEIKKRKVYFAVCRRLYGFVKEWYLLNENGSIPFCLILLVINCAYRTITFSFYWISYNIRLNFELFILFLYFFWKFI